MKIPNLRHYALLIITLFVASCGAAGSSPSTPTSIPTAIEFAGADMVVSMGGSLSLTSNADFSGGQVKFTDLATGELDTSGICGSSSIDGTSIEITGPSTWPNLQSQCGVCFEYDGACLPVDHTVAASIAPQLDPSSDESPANEDVITVDTGANIGFEITAAGDIIFETQAESYMVNIGEVVSYEKNLGTTNAISEVHFCGYNLESSSYYGGYAASKLAHVVSSDGLATAISEYLSSQDDLLSQNCTLDVRDDSAGNKIVAVVGVGHLCLGSGSCAGLRAVLYINGSGIEVVSVNQTQGATFHVDGIAIDSSGDVHVVYHHSNNIYYKSCSSSSCGDAMTVAAEIREEDDEGLSVYTTFHEGTVYVAYTRDDDGDGYADAMTRTISDNTVGDEIKWSSANAANGTARMPMIDVYRNPTTLQLITAVAYSYELAKHGYISISPGVESKFTDVDPLGSPTQMGALVISKGGFIYIGANVTDASSTPHAKYSRGEISGTGVTFPQASIQVTDLVIEYRGYAFVSRVGRFNDVYATGVEVGNYIYSYNPIRMAIGQAY